MGTAHGGVAEVPWTTGPARAGPVVQERGVGRRDGRLPVGMGSGLPGVGRMGGVAVVGIAASGRMGARGATGPA